MKTWYSRKDRKLWRQAADRELLSMRVGAGGLLCAGKKDGELSGEEGTDEILGFLQGLRRLEGVSPDCLVASPAMLPPESIRFFYVDENWIDSLVDGALSTGGKEYCGWDGQPRQDAQEEVRTGFLLRSVLVKAFPALTVTPKAGKRELSVERLAYMGEDVLLGIVSGEMDSIVFTEPEESLLCEFVYNEQGLLCAGEEPVTYRKGAAQGVVDIGTLSKQLEKEQGTFTAAEFGRLLLRDRLEYCLDTGGKTDE